MFNEIHSRGSTTFSIDVTNSCTSCFNIRLMKVCIYRAISLTWPWPATIQIYWNERKCLDKKKGQFPQDWRVTLTWPPFLCFCETAMTSCESTLYNTMNKFLMTLNSLTSPTTRMMSYFAAKGSKSNHSWSDDNWEHFDRLERTSDASAKMSSFDAELP